MATTRQIMEKGTGEKKKDGVGSRDIINKVNDVLGRIRKRNGVYGD